MTQKLHSVFFAGTASDVGKSVIAAGFCRILKQDGYQPVPFKAQNMSLNSYATPDGFEIGRAQAVQAEACGLPCHTDMNPVLLKPTTEKSSQIVLHGKPLKNQSAYDYFSGKDQQFLFDEVKGAYNRLSEKYNPVVMEGAGSISELNLKDRDIVNMRMAAYANAAVYLVADIERGGVFASVYGSIALLSEQERSLVKGIIINKFCGDSRLFEAGKLKIEELTGVPVVGVVPKFTDIHIEEEDSVALQTKKFHPQPGKVNVAVVRLKRISNFTDFNSLEKQPSVNLYYALTPDDLAYADIIIVPGTKNTIEDLLDLKQRKMADAIVSFYQKGKTVIGICGGYQMLGRSIADPHHVESAMDEVDGLGLLPVRTVLSTSKTTRQCHFRYKSYETECKGYEIHMGETFAELSSPLNLFTDGLAEGYVRDERCWGSYIHGILDNAVVMNDLLSRFVKDRNLTSFDFHSFKEEQYDKLAAFLRQHVNVDLIYKQIKL
jgi:adenosylcobyric acid synthase